LREYGVVRVVGEFTRALSRSRQERAANGAPPTLQ
jgi:hypothetical protein